MKRVFSSLAMLTIVLAPLAARADDDALDAIAEARFKEGVSYAKQGKYEQARASFLQTLALSPGSPRVLLNLAISEHGAGRLVDALGHLKTYLASPKVDPKKAQEIRQSLYDELWRGAGHLRIQAERGDAVTLDRDVKLGNAPLTDVVDVTPGIHHVTAGTDDVEVTVGAGETKDIVLTHAPATAATTPPTMERREAPAYVDASYAPTTSRSTTAWKPLTFVLGGATLLAAGAAFYFNVKSREAKDRADSIRAEHGSADCSTAALAAYCSDLRDARGDQDRFASTSKAFWIGGGVLLVATGASAVLWASTKSRGSAAAFVPFAGPRAAGGVFRVAF